MFGLTVTSRASVQRRLCFGKAMTIRKRKQQRLEESRLQRAKLLSGVDPTGENTPVPPGAVADDAAQLTHNNTYGFLPRFLVEPSGFDFRMKCV
jgi:hypothetical protein